MKILFDQGTPVPLRSLFSAHVVSTAYEMSWSDLSNGDLLTVAENEGFDVLITTDQHLRYEQNLSGKRLAILVLTTTSWPKIRQSADLVVASLDKIQPGELREVLFPG